MDREGELDQGFEPGRIGMAKGQKETERSLKDIEAGY